MGKKKNKKETLPLLDFSSLVLPFYTQALVKLGEVEDPLSKKKEENLEFAKRLIDLLDLLKKKTEGNLKKEEKEFLDTTLYQLKMIYLKKANVIKL